MIAFALLFLAFMSLPMYPVLALICVSGAFWSAKSWTGAGEDVLELVLFYGALIGCLVVWL